ncbi:hypothetical protein BTO19_25870 [Vibrio parahaemolyticus]|nr:hypothetical protein BTO19_25870 [Vibrio parahaemolyticus]TBT59570.1 hypothetical protein D5E77_26345 [Vibrio parahaemolyticus]TOQ56197.1 hypothetical protein CGG92_25065 [Vibrio parahaemolyticus]
MSAFQEVNHKLVFTWPPKARNTKRVNPLPSPMRQPGLASTDALSFQTKRKTMLNCRGNCQAEMLLGKCVQSDLEPVKLETNRYDLQMKQPANIDMF